jgi:hypothetical protein
MVVPNIIARRLNRFFPNSPFFLLFLTSSILVWVCLAIYYKMIGGWLLK